MDQTIYKCRKCGRTAPGNESEIPECCGLEMEEFIDEKCITAKSPETHRADDDDDACDDGRSGI